VNCSQQLFARDRTRAYYTQHPRSRQRRLDECAGGFHYKLQNKHIKMTAEDSRNESPDHMFAKALQFNGIVSRDQVGRIIVIMIV